jgi:hypothetical protein
MLNGSSQLIHGYPYDDDNQENTHILLLLLLLLLLNLVTS